MASLQAVDHPLIVEPFTLDIRSAGGEITIALAGELDLATASRLSAALGDVGGEPCRILLDLADVTFVDCTGLAAIARAASGRGALGGELVVCHPQPVVHRLFELCALSHLLRPEDEVLVSGSRGARAASEPPASDVLALGARER